MPSKICQHAQIQQDRIFRALCLFLCYPHLSIHFNVKKLLVRFLTFIVDKLSNGNRIVAITVYVPANFVVSGTESFRVVKVRGTVSIHTTYSCQKGYQDVIIDGIHECVPNPPEHTPEYLIGLKYGTMDGQVGIYDLAAACGKYHGTAFDHCSFGYRTAYVTNCLDPSCTQSLTPSTTTPPLTSVPPSTPPTTKRCPDGSVIDANANCPTQSTPATSPNTPSPPPPSNNPPPSGSNNGGGGGSSGSGGSGSGSGGGSGPSQPTTVS
jgi:uncharacterized membrane protein YgcG